MGVDAVLDDIRDRVWRVSEAGEARLSSIARLLARAPSEAFLRGHRENALVQLAIEFGGGPGVYLGDAVEWLRQVLDGRLGRERVRVFAGEAGDALLVAVAGADAISGFELLPLHSSTLIALEQAAMLGGIQGLSGNDESSDGFEVDCPLADLEEIAARLGTPWMRYPVAALAVGVDRGSGKLYIHVFPRPLAAVVASILAEGGLDEATLRELMGFDLQPWEPLYRPEGGLRVRVQGDLVAEVLELCGGGECRLRVLPAALRVLGAGRRLFASAARRLLSRVEALSCRELARRPGVAAERLSEALSEAAPEWAVEVLRPLGLSSSQALMSLLARQPLSLDLSDCRIELKAGSRDVEGVPPDTYILFLYSPLEIIVHVKGKTFRRRVSDAMTKSISLKALAAAALEEAPTRFRAVVNESHVVKGRGVAGASAMVDSARLDLPTAASRASRAACAFKGSRSRLGALKALAWLAATALFYARYGDLYIYTVDGSLSFSHPEHGDTQLDLGGPGVVRVTTLNSAPRPPPAVLREAARLLGGRMT